MTRSKYVFNAGVPLKEEVLGSQIENYTAHKNWTLW